MNNEPVSPVERVQSYPIVVFRNKTIIPLTKSKKIFFLAIILLVFGLFLIALILTLILMFTLISNRNVHCAANSTKTGNECRCNLGYSGDGYTYCDECGLVYNQSNLRIVGGKPANGNKNLIL
jgi:hypothetical protein